MRKFTIKTDKIIGFAAEESPIGSTSVKVQVNCELITSDNPKFHVWMSHITQMFLSKIPVNPLLIQRFLIIIHENNEADIYVNDFQQIAQAEMKEKPTKPGEPVFLKDVTDITELRFPDIKIEKTDAVIYCSRSDWRFSLFFDFRREIDEVQLYKDLGKVIKEAKFYSVLASAKDKIDNAEFDEADCIVFTEGKTDIKHLEKAHDVLGSDLSINFWVNEQDLGDGDLLRMCEHLSRVPQRIKSIFIFDRDVPRILRKLESKGSLDGFQSWGNNTYSFCLPVPDDRKDKKYGITIEFFYKDKDLLRKDKNGRRIYLSDEFEKESGTHKTEPLNCINPKINREETCIIDDGVFQSGKSMALSKSAFADAIFDEDENFKALDHTNFAQIYGLIDSIVRAK